MSFVSSQNANQMACGLASKWPAIVVVDCRSVIAAAGNAPFRRIFRRR